MIWFSSLTLRNCIYFPFSSLFFILCIRFWNNLRLTETSLQLWDLSDVAKRTVGEIRPFSTFSPGTKRHHCHGKVVCLPFFIFQLGENIFYMKLKNKHSVGLHNKWFVVNGRFQSTLFFLHMKKETQQFLRIAVCHSIFLCTKILMTNSCKHKRFLWDLFCISSIYIYNK